ncbi:hypothetical protein HK104_004697 [Borealophlyctis nickersoniae]|nr:hypothetical protein HK104_004697 [Borealophlyctis nickersoniae]
MSPTSPRLMLVVAALLALLSSQVAAVTLTYRMAPHERACFHAAAKEAGEKVAFYFAVQSGGSFDIDYDVTDPNSAIILQGHKERQGDFVFTAKMAGEYTFCFSNVMSTFAEKYVDFDITVEHESHKPATNPLEDPKKEEKKEAVKKDLERLEGGIENMQMYLGNVQRLHKHFRTRENRNFSTVQSTESRIFWFATVESCMIVGIALVQVFVIQTFFNKSGRPRV